MRLLELQNERDSAQACAAIGRELSDLNLRGWAVLLEQPKLAEGLQKWGLPVLRGPRGALALGSISQLWNAARALGAQELMRRAACVESPAAWKLPRSALPSRTLVMGVINATPDSFSDGGAYDPVEQGLRLAAEGADILDVGGESTRPGAEPVSAKEERERTVPVIRKLAAQVRVPLSIDTTKAAVAAAALDAGAEIVNDISGFARDPEMAVAARGGAICLMHLRGTPQDMQARAHYSDLLGEVQAELIEALDRARAAGIPEERIALDPGLGFAKTADHNLLLLRRLRELTQLGRPLIVGASR